MNDSKKVKKIIKRILFPVAVILIVMISVTGFIFRNEISIITSIHKEDGEYPFYVMEYKNGYHLDEMLEKNISTDKELADVLTEYISHGFYSGHEAPKGHAGCATLTCKTEDGRVLWGRNFDWHNAVPIVVHSTPKNGYASISTCDFTNITGNESSLPEGIANSFLAVAAYYVPMDGINEKGLCVAELEVNEGGQKLVDTKKNNITVTMAIRLLLDRASNVDEAIALLEQYDICPTGGISSHLSISDRSGKAVAVEFMEGKIEVVPTNVVTNFNIKNADISAGGESAMNRYLILTEAYESAGGIMPASDLTEAMEKATVDRTRWTIIYEDTGEDSGFISATYYWNGDFQYGYVQDNIILDTTFK